jgi:hypothetical protein
MLFVRDFSSVAKDNGITVVGNFDGTIRQIKSVL